MKPFYETNPFGNIGKKKLKTTDKQIAANARNAQKSTGPITPSGKAKATQNALKHGLLARDIVVGIETSEEFERFRDALAERLAPHGELEVLLAQRIIAGAWRLRRAGRIEQEMLDTMFADATAEQDFDELTRLPGSPELGTTTLGAVLSKASWRWDRLNNVVRYESHLERIVFKSLHELNRVQAARNSQPVIPPAIIDIDVTGVKAE